MKPPTYHETLAPFFDPASPRIGIEDLSMADYRMVSGIAPSDLKIGSEDIGPRQFRGHLTQIANDRLIRWHQSNDLLLPPGLDAPRQSKDFQIGSVYHTLLLQPETFDQQYAVLTPEIEDGLVAVAKERKRAKAPQKFSGRLKEASAWKKENGREPNEAEQAEILRQAQSRYIGEVSFHSRLTEYTDWVAQQLQGGKEIIDSATVDHANRMIDALYRHPENSEVGEYVKSLQISPVNTEKSLFAVAEFTDEYPTIQIKGRPDILPAGDAIIDPKTALCPHPDSFAYAVETFHYDLSMAFYCILTELLAGHESAAALDFPKTRSGFLVHCKTPPYLARLWWLPEDWLRCAKREVQAELAKIAKIWKQSQGGRKLSGDFMQTQIGELLPSPWKQSMIEAA